MIQGRVYDRNTGTGIAGVPVSNGENIVTTGDDGGYELPTHPPAHRFVFITTPDTHAPAGDFSHPISSTTDTVDFPLLPAPERQNPDVCFLHITDTHVGEEDDLELYAGYLRDDLPMIIERERPAFVVVGGDLTAYGSIEQLTRYREIVSAASVPVYSCYGAHDGFLERNDKSHGDNYTTNYEQVLGPDTYSFNRGGRHIVMMLNEAKLQCGYVECDDPENGFFHSCLSPEDQERRRRWLHADLALHDGMETVLVLHGPPGDVFIDSVAGTGVRLMLFGHWHASKVYRRNGILIAGTPTLSFGTDENVPRGYRVVSWGECGVQAPMKPTQDTPAVPAVQAGSSITWSRRLPAPCSTPPIALEDRLFLSLQDENGFGQDGVACLNTSDGGILWHTCTDSAVKNSVALADGFCVAVSVCGRVYALDAATGDTRWKHDLPRFDNHWIYTSPAVVAGTVYAGTGFDIRALDLHTGEERWTTSEPWRIQWPCFATPVIWNDLLITYAQRRGLRAYSRHDGAVVWTTPQMKLSYLRASHVATGDNILTMRVPEGFCLIDPQTGDAVHTLASCSPFEVTVDGHRVYVAERSGTVKALDLRTGEQLWQFSTGQALHDYAGRFKPAMVARPVVQGGLVYAGGCDGVLYALNADTGTCSGREHLHSPVTALGGCADGVVVVTGDGSIRSCSVP